MKKNTSRPNPKPSSSKNAVPISPGRRDFVKTGLAAAAGATLGAFPLLGQKAKAQSRPPNILFISIDDLNDFPSPFGGYPGLLTPNFTKLATQGLAFQRAYCSAPYCGASRSSLLSGIAPYRSGLMEQANIVQPDVEAGVINRLGLPNLITLPRFFRAQNYRVLGGGKVYHGGFGQGAANVNYDGSAWHEWYNTDFHQIAQVYPGVKNYRDSRTLAELDSGSPVLGSLPHMIGSDYNTPDQEALMPDKLVAQWASQKLMERATSPNEPFFLAVGFFRPHIAHFVPQRFYDLYPLNTIQVPAFNTEIQDLVDLPPFAVRYLVNMDWSSDGKKLEDGSEAGDLYQLEHMALKDGRSGMAQFVQSYLASTTFVDECLGQVLSALDRSGLGDNTIVVVWSDHGWFLGEKLGWRKYKLWERACRTPLIVSRPGGPTGNCQRVVSLLDIFPTLVELVQGSISSDLERQLNGQSFKPLLENPNMPWGNAAITTQSVPESGLPPFHSVRTERWRYIRYPDMPGAAFSEELYDLSVDPTERRNLLYWDPTSYSGVRDALLGILKQKLG